MNRVSEPLGDVVRFNMDARGTTILYIGWLARIKRFFLSKRTENWNSPWENVTKNKRRHEREHSIRVIDWISARFRSPGESDARGANNNGAGIAPRAVGLVNEAGSARQSGASDQAGRECP